MAPVDGDAGARRRPRTARDRSRDCTPRGWSLGVKARCRAGLVDDLDWLAPAAAGAALYELASALPLGPEQRELGRRVLARLMAADAATFVAIAWRMALGAAQGPRERRQVRARVALVTELPISARRLRRAPGVGDRSAPRAGPRVDRRAFHGLAGSAAAGGAAHRARSARGRAARVVRRRARPARLPFRRGVAGVAAPARGPRVARVAPRRGRARASRAVGSGVAQGDDDALYPELTPTEWRRAATSVAAHRGGGARGGHFARQTLAQGRPARARSGRVLGLLWGLARAAEADRDAAAELLDLVMDEAQPEVGEAVVELRAELGESPVVDAAASAALGLLRKRAKGGGRRRGRGAAPGGRARPGEAERARTAAARTDCTCPRGVRSSGAKEAYALARDALAAAQGALYALEAVKAAEEDAEGKAGTIARRTARSPCCSTWTRACSSATCSRAAGARRRRCGAHRDRRARPAARPARRVDPRARGGGAPVGADSGGAAVVPKHATLSLRRLRALLHLVDGDIGDEETDAPRAARLRKRWTAHRPRPARPLRERSASPVRRTVMAALARALDALVRVGACDVVDALLLVART